MKTLIIEDIKQFQKIAKALSHNLRIKIYELLQSNNLIVNEISESLNIPKSTISVNLKILEESGLIIMEPRTANKGGQEKICKLKYESIILRPIIRSKENLILTMPIGNFIKFKVEPPCGLASDKKVIGEYDHIPSFYQAERINAQLLWFSNGYVDYYFPNEIPRDVNIIELEFSVEICSEDIGYNKDYPSDITLWINKKKIATWTSPGDFGGIRGKYTPKWWPINSTQYGKLIKWKLNSKGSFINEKHASAMKIKDLELSRKPYIRIRMGIDEEAENRGGINIFGSKFGNYNQELCLKITYLKQK